MSADLMRRFLTIVEAPNHELDLLFRDEILSESILYEGAVADRIKAAMAKVSQRFGRATPQVLDQVAGRAEGLYSGVPAVKAVVDRAKALGRSPALLAAMVGICGALISLSPNPAAAQDAAGKLQPILSLQDVNQIADLLASHGITLQKGQTETSALPSGLTDIQVKAAKTLKAINDSDFRGDVLHGSERSYMNGIAIEGGITKEDAVFSETVSLWTLDHKLLIAEYSTTFAVQDGAPAVVDESGVGLRVDLWKVFDGLDEATQVQVSNYINQTSNMAESAPSPAMQAIERMLKAKGPAICQYVAQMAMRNGRIAAKIRITPKGVQVGGSAA